ncbi:MAG: nicotinate-nucleotide--dimethylbenzimidazole phosphoribosyltransferase [Candidatus Dormibacteria bacterium]
MSDLERVLASIRPVDADTAAVARLRQDHLTKPPRSLGRLEGMSIQLAAIKGAIDVPLERRAVLVFAADHGVVAEGVSAYPSDVTAQMVLNFLVGGAAVNAIAQSVGARVVVIDAGVAGEIPGDDPRLRRLGIRAGTGNMAKEPAMTRSEAVAAIEGGIGIFEEALAEGLDLVAVGDMGIGNTTAATALVSVFCGVSSLEIVGRGTGIDDVGLARKAAVIATALGLHRPDPADPVGALAAVGGLELGAIAGAVLAASAARVPVVIDGHIATAAALVAAALAPPAVGYMFAGHQSQEPGHKVALRHLGLRPVLDLEMRLGEGTGALLAMPILAAAAAVLVRMATFEEAGVSGPSHDGGPMGAEMTPPPADFQAAT